MSDTVFYRLVKETISHTPGCLVTAAVWSCQLCGETIDGMGGPGSGEICVKCGDDILAGRVKYDRAARAAYLGEKDD